MLAMSACGLKIRPRQRNPLIRNATNGETQEQDQRVATAAAEQVDHQDREQAERLDRTQTAARLDDLEQALAGE